MRLTVALLMSLTAFAADPVIPPDAPQAEISNGVITAKLLMPDAQKGYYRGTRFDWSGQIYSLRANNHEYFGQWFQRYDPKINDAIMGPVEEFMPGEKGLGYDEAKPGEEFIRIGVGAVRKPDEKAYQRFQTYEITDSGKWTVKTGKDWAEYTQDLPAHNGYAYRYTKRISLAKGKPEMTIEHTLKNTGTKKISAQQYNHNFFVIDDQPTGPDSSVKFPFDLKPQKPVPADLAEIKGRDVGYLKELQRGQTVMIEMSDGFSGKASDYDIRVENKKAGAGVRIQGDQPVTKLVYWSIRPTTCPEAYVPINVEPGKQSKWTYKYTFYEVK